MIKFYVIKKSILLLLMLGALNAWSQTKVTGRVTSGEDGTALPGVSILEKGTSNGTVTDIDGDYAITTGENAILVFSFVGFASQEVSVAGQTTLNVILTTDAKTLSEVVVVGYGEVQRKDATGAVSIISNKDFNQGILSSPQDLLVGKLAGVTINTNNGAPGSNATIRIRGGASMSASNDPLIVIDGFPVDNSRLAGLSNPLATLNPNDIETFTVLKDASATAIYGSRASNGVIIITTKKGREGKPQFSYNVNASVSTPVKYMDVLTGDEYRALVNELAANGISGLNQTAVSQLGTANTDWQKEIFRSAFSHDHNVSASGAFKKLPYRVSYGYTDQQGILKNTGLNRHSLNISLTPTLLDDHLQLTLNAKGSRINNNFGETGAVGNAITFDPTKPVKDGNETYGGYYSWLSMGPAFASATDNPVAQILQTDNRAIANRIIANIQADYKFHFLPDLKLTINTGVDRAASDGHNRAGLDAQFTKNNSGVLQGKNNTYSGRNQSELFDLYFNYTKQLHLHKIDLTAGYGWQHFYREGESRNSNTEGTIVTTPPPFKNENFLVSFFGRINYSLKGKYLLTATLRNDGSSRFSEENRWGLFPAVALAWRVKDESFLTGVKVLSDLKLRAGYGQTGQQDLSLNQYPYLPIYRESTPTAQYQLGDTSNFYHTLRPEAYDANIKWETTTTYNLGLDFGFANDRITGSVELYQRETKDLLNYIQVANGTNFSNFVNTNVGNLENKGIEISLRAIPVETESFSWTVGFNLARNVNKITKLLLVDDPKYTGVSAGNIGVDAFIQNQQVGYPVNSFFVYQQVYNESGLPIEGLYIDRSGAGGSVVGNTLNKYRYEKPAADVLMGINSRLNYKKLDFSFSGRISVGNYVYNNNLASRAFYNRVYDLGFFSNVPTAISDTKFINQQTYSDYYVQDASFFKMDNMSIGYNLDQLFSDKVKARISFTAQNAFIITKYDGIDPEVNGGEGTDGVNNLNGIDNNIYPRPRVFLVGVNVTF